MRQRSGRAKGSQQSTGGREAAGNKEFNSSCGDTIADPADCLAGVMVELVVGATQQSTGFWAPFIGVGSPSLKMA